MFYLKVDDKRKPSDTRNLQIVEGEKLRVIALRDKLLSFYDFRHPVLLIGEALSPINELELHRAYKHLAMKNGSHIPNEKILSLIIVNVDNGQVQIYRNISSNRPLYYHLGENSLSCSSHISLFRDDVPDFGIDENVIPEYLVYRYVMPPKTLYRGISYLPGGWKMSLDLPDGKPATKNIIAPEPNKRQVKPDEAVETVSELIRRSLSFLTQTSQPATLLLSGGLDSTMLGAFCREIGVAADSISSGFHCITGDPGETVYAKSAAENLGLLHYVHDLGRDEYVPWMIDSIAAAEEPLHHLQSVVLGSLFASAIKPDIRYLLNGESADMVFCNSQHLDYWRARRLIRFTDPRPVRALASPIMTRLARSNDRIRYLLFDHSSRNYGEDHFLWSLGAYGDIAWVKSRYGVSQNQITAGRSNFLENYRDWPLLDRITYLTLAGENDTTMRIWGKLAERNGRIMVYPYTYPDLMFYMMSIDWRLKARQTKFLLRKVAGRMGLPDEIIYRPKRSFGFPVKYWALPGTLFQPLVEMACEMFDKPILQALQSPEPARAMILWSMLNIYLADKLVVRQVPATQLKEEIISRQPKTEKVMR